MAPISSKRLTETWLGRAAAVLLLLIWVGSMSSTDSNGYSYFPVLVGLGLVVLLGLAALLMGAKAVRLPWLAWGSLGVGAYFLVRAFLSPSMPEAWVEISIILACMVFYVAGVYAAQGRRAWPLLTALSVALVLNIAFWWLMKQPWAPIEWTGRPAVGPCSVNSRPVTLLVYKNWAGSFLFIGGAVLAAAVLWLVKGKRSLICLLPLSIAAMYLAGECGTRAVYLLAPVMLAVGVALTVLQRLFSDEKMGAPIILASLSLMVAFVIGVYALFFDRTVLESIVSIDSHSRFDTWKDVVQILPDAPLWGYGVGGVRHYFQAIGDMGNVNYAHNEYLELWADYGLIGIGMALAVIVLHVAKGCCTLASPLVSGLRRVQTSLAVLTLVAWASCAVCDYMWHQIAQAAMTAFACGMLASPYPDEDKYGHQNAVKAESCMGKTLLTIGMLGIAGIVAQGVQYLSPLWFGQWEYNRLAATGEDEEGTARRALLKTWIINYPKPELADSYMSLPGSGKDWGSEKQMLMNVIRANPINLFTVTQLGLMMTDHHECKEAELLYRRYFPGDGSKGIYGYSISGFYQYNLYCRAQDCMKKGNFSTAVSLLRYATKMNTKGFSFALNLRNVGDQWKVWRQFLADRQTDLKLLEMQGIEPDDSWMEPMEPGGKPSLYRRWALPDSPEAKAAKK